MWGLVAGLALIGTSALLERATSRPLRQNRVRRNSGRKVRPHVRSLVNALASSYYQRAILEWSGRSVAKEDAEIAATRERLLAQGMTPIELRILEADLKAEASQFRKLGLRKNHGRRFHVGDIVEVNDRHRVWRLARAIEGTKPWLLVGVFLDTGERFELGETFWNGIVRVPMQGNRRRRSSRKMRRNGMTVVEEKSPLTYNHGASVLRLSLVDSDAPPPASNEVYFVERVMKSSNGRKTKIHGASPGVVAWIDYHLIPGYGETGRGVYIDYTRTRSDQTQRGHMKRLMSALFDKYPGDDMNFGDIVSDHVEKVWRRMRDDKSLGRRIYGKIR